MVGSESVGMVDVVSKRVVVSGVCVHVSLDVVVFTSSVVGGGIVFDVILAGGIISVWSVVVDCCSVKLLLGAQ